MVSKKSLAKNDDLKDFHYSDEDLRWATPEIVADYRAERLRCDTIIDLGCGIGFQTIAFAKRCSKVYAVEIDGRKIGYAKKNATILGLKNIEFITGDMLSPEIVKKIKKADIIFCDPERLPEEKERTLQSIIPDAHKILEIYSKITPNLAIEFPPQIKSIPFDCEKEYLSLDGSLNRLTLYFGGLKRFEKSAVIFPSKKIIRRSADAKLRTAKELQKYLYEADPAVVKADLLPELSAATKTPLFSKGKAVFFTSEQKVSSSFFKNSFEIIGASEKEEEIIDLLKKNNIGKVLIRYAVPPEEYWLIRNKFERKLSGDQKGSLFRFGKLWVVGKEIN